MEHIKTGIEVLSEMIKSETQYITQEKLNNPKYIDSIIQQTKYPEIYTDHLRDLLFVREMLELEEFKNRIHCRIYSDDYMNNIPDMSTELLSNIFKNLHEYKDLSSELEDKFIVVDIIDSSTERVSICLFINAATLYDFDIAGTIVTEVVPIIPYEKDKRRFIEPAFSIIDMGNGKLKCRIASLNISYEPNNNFICRHCDHFREERNNAIGISCCRIGFKNKLDCSFMEEENPINILKLTNLVRYIVSIYITSLLTPKKEKVVVKKASSRTTKTHAPSNKNNQIKVFEKLIDSKIKIIRVGDSDDDVDTTRPHGHHKSPVTHERSGHFRHYKSGKVVWVNSSIVNKDKNTPVIYNIKGV